MRRRKLLSQKAVSSFLGNRTNDQLSRYERGVQIPSLKNALKLGIIYDIPIRVLLDRYFEECRRETLLEGSAANMTRSAIVQEFEGKADSSYCTFEVLLRRRTLDQTDRDKLGSHIKVLMDKRAEGLGHK
jgi:transcriptional regulator with XRE-family HTH domain